VTNLCLDFLKKEYGYNYKKSKKFIILQKAFDKLNFRTDKHKLKILVKGRLNRDILRTLAHEWSHEYQRTVLKRKKGPDIGGKNEDEANSESGAIMKKFEKAFPDSEERLYE